MYLRLIVVCCTTFAPFMCAQLPGSDSGEGSGPEITIRPRPSKRTSVAVGQPSSHVVRADVKVVLVPVTVTDEASRPINDLPKERFRILEDGVEQQITSFSWEDGPVSLGLLFDSSGSMKSRINASIAALKYVFQTTRPDDEFFVIQFSDYVRQLGGFTSDPDEIQRRLGFVGVRNPKQSDGSRCSYLRHWSFLPASSSATAGRRDRRECPGRTKHEGAS
jgi:VWFA-related protein